MVQSKILLDSNSYFRLAKSIHPLLFQEFGTHRYCLYVLDELQKEYDRQPRLQNKFPWVDDPEYRDNRNKSPHLSKTQKKDIKTTYDVIWDYVVNECPGPSQVDVLVLSYGYVLQIPVVTDDTDMIALAEEFGIKILKTLELLKLMLDCGHIDMRKVLGIAAYWSYEDDRPAGYAQDFRRLFDSEPPP